MLNPHEKFFKETFSDLAVTKDFLNHYLPTNVIEYIELDTLTPKKDSFINDELNKKEWNTSRRSFAIFLAQERTLQNKKVESTYPEGSDK